MNRARSRRRRSWIVVPASRPTLIADAAAAAPDVVVLDLVEFVVDRDKDAARNTFRDAMAIAGARGAEVFLQTAPATFEVDLAAAVWPGLNGVVVSRVESVSEVDAFVRELDRLELERAMPLGEVELVAGVETARGNHAAYDIACASRRISAVTLGRADLVMDLRPEPSGEIHLLPYLMQRLVIIARAARVTPFGAWWRAPDRGLLATAENTYEAACRGRAIGFKGAMCIRPAQVEPLNRAFDGAGP
jgi:citrate lyase subunit beta / citryl-CoA lyase